MLGSVKKVIIVLLGASMLLMVALLVVPALLGSEGFWTTVLWTRGPMHHLAELALAAMFTLLAQRAWTRADLGQIARKQGASQVVGDERT